MCQFETLFCFDTFGEDLARKDDERSCLTKAEKRGERSAFFNSFFAPC